MDAGINNVIYMELHSGPKLANGRCRKMIVEGTIDRGSTVLYCVNVYCVTATGLQLTNISKYLSKVCNCMVFDEAEFTVMQLRYV
jgi:hypothetical protein